MAQAIGRAVIQQGCRVLYREAHTRVEELANTTLDGTRQIYLADLAAVPLLIVDDLGMRTLPHTAAEDLLEIIMRWYERASTRPRACCRRLTTVPRRMSPASLRSRSATGSSSSARRDPRPDARPYGKTDPGFASDAGYSQPATARSRAAYKGGRS